MPKLGYKYLNFQILVIKVYFLKIKKISAHNLSGGADTQNFSYTQINQKPELFYKTLVLNSTHQCSRHTQDTSCTSSNNVLLGRLFVCR
ncbi:hypothetical protein B9N49_00215 [Finegoldia magna]|uniref:Uncharacterized protein n=1 Tax=Finegoldia magna TaxID=1260 RepID=A0A233VA44_FINMA|nr:hypothetical protein B9N49_00215 [Finegoldia magna]